MKLIHNYLSTVLLILNWRMSMNGRLSDPEGKYNDGTMIRDPQTGVYRNKEEQRYQEECVKEAKKSLEILTEDFNLLEFLRPLFKSY